MNKKVVFYRSHSTLGSFLYYWYGNLPNNLLTLMEDLPEQGVKDEAEITILYESYWLISNI